MNKKYQNKRYNSKKKDAKGKSASTETEDYKCAKESKTNDPSWYAVNQAILDSVATVPFSLAQGTSFQIFSGAGGSWTVPGILVHEVNPTPCSTGPSSALNVSATALYSYVRHANSGSANYDAPDLMLYCIAMAQVYSAINWAMRVYGTANLYSYDNRYLPQALVESNYVDFTDIIAHMADFRYGINTLIYKASSFAVPATIPYFQRLAYLFAGLYSEAETTKSQIYMNVPVGFLKYQETTSTTGGSLALVVNPGYSSKMTASQIISYISNLMDPLLTSEDIGIMSGDVLKAYGDSGILKMATLGTDYTVLPMTDLHVLEQFQNAYNVANLTPSTAVPNNTITQNSRGALLSNVNFNYAPNGVPYYYSILNNHVLNTLIVNPTPGDVMEMTRLKSTYYVWEQDSAKYLSPDYGSEFVRSTKIYRFEGGNLNSYVVPTIQTINTATIADVVKLHCLAEAFKFHPAMFYWTQATAGGTDQSFNGVALDFDNYTTIDDSVLNNMNRAAMLGLFNVPSIARFQ